MWTPALTEALKDFQTALGVEPTGTVDAATMRSPREGDRRGTGRTVGVPDERADDRGALGHRYAEPVRGRQQLRLAGPTHAAGCSRGWVSRMALPTSSTQAGNASWIHCWSAEPRSSATATR